MKLGKVETAIFLSKYFAKALQRFLKRDCMDALFKNVGLILICIMFHKSCLEQFFCNGGNWRFNGKSVVLEKFRGK